MRDDVRFFMADTMFLRKGNDIPVEEKIKKVAELIKQSKHTTVMTGAGISKDSGISTFRDDDGTYSKYPSDIFSIKYFKKDPKKFYEAFNERFATMLTAKPNDGHKVIANLMKEGLVHNIITQNIDELHKKAIEELDADSSEKRRLIRSIYEMHGNVRNFYYITEDERKSKTIEEVITPDLKVNYEVQEDGVSYILKPDVVLFGEEVKYYMESAMDVMPETDLIIIAGTSLEVFPFADLPRFSKKNTKIVVINKSEVKTEYPIDIFIQEGSTEILKAIYELIKTM